MPVVDLTIDSSKSVSGLKQYDSAVNNSATKTDTAFSKMRASASDFALVAGVIAVGFGAVAVKFSLHALTIASKMVETQGVFDSTFAGMTDQAEAWAQNLQDNYHLSAVNAKGYLNTLHLVTTGMGLSKQVAGEMSNKLVKVASDLGAAFDTETVDVVRDIRSALSGSMETMDKYGVVIRQAQVKQKALEMGLAATKKEITQADKATATYQLILEKTATTTGTTAKEAKGYAWQLKEAKKNIEDLTTSIGTKLLPIGTKLLTMFNELVSEAGRVDSIVNGLLETVRFLGNGFLGLEIVFKATIVVVAKMFEHFTLLLKPIDLILAALVKLGAIDTNPLDELNQLTKDFTASAVEGLQSTIEKVDNFNAAIDRTKIKTEEVAETTKSSLDIVNDAVAESAKEQKALGNEIGTVADKVKDELKPAETELKDEIDKVTTAAKESTTALEGQAGAASKVAAAANEVANASQRTSASSEGTYEASKAWSGGKSSMGSAPDMTQAEQDYYNSVVTQGSGDHYWDSDYSAGKSGLYGGDHVNDNLDTLLMQQENALSTIYAARDSNGGEPVTSITNIFNQNISRSDVTNIIEEQQRQVART